MIKPNLIIAGCQKSGTTWLHSSLRKSPQIFGSAVKELNFFNKRDFEKRVDDYLRNFPETPGAQYYMESTPHYFQKPQRRIDIAANIRSFLDDPKIVVSFRDPVDRYESAYIHHMMQGRFPYTEKIDNFSDDYKMLSLGLYSEILPHWREIFPDLGVFFYDDIVLDRNAFVLRVMQFLEIENDIPEEDLRFRTNDKNMKVRNQKLDWPAMPTLGEDLRMKLVEFYVDDVSRLQVMTRRDLSHWLVAEPTDE